MIQSIILILIGSLSLFYVIGANKAISRNHYEYQPVIQMFSLNMLITLASKNGFVITNDSIYDTINKVLISIDHKLSEQEIDNKYKDDKDSFIYASYKGKLIFNRALRDAIMKQPRFVQSILPNYKPDIVF